MREGFVIAGIVSLAIFASVPVAQSDPIIPHTGGIIEQTNMTGHFEAVAVFSDDSFVAVGAIEEIQLTSTILSLTPNDALIVRYAESGAFHWARQPNWGPHDILMDVAVAADESIVAVGYTFVDTQLTQARWPWVTNYSKEGTLNWELNVSSSSLLERAELRALLIDGGTVVAVGREMETSPRPLVVRVLANGTLDGVLTLADHEWETFTDVAAGDQTGTFYVSGARRHGSGVYGCQYKTNVTAVIWRECGEEEESHSVANRGGTVVGAGWNQTTTGESAFLARRTSSGSLSAAYEYASSTGFHEDEWYSVASSANADFVSGHGGNLTLCSSVSLGCSLQFDSLNPPDMESAKYASDGTREWVAQYNELAATFGLGNALDGEPRLLVAGGKVGQGIILGSYFSRPFIVRYESLG
jgi:hypothetical protein